MQTIQPKATNKGCSKNVGLFILGFVVLCFIIDHFDTTKPPKDASGNIVRTYESEAYVTTMGLVKNKLRNPLEADFPWAADQTRLLGKDSFRIVGHVETKNDYGVKKLLKFYCTLHYLGDVARDEAWKNAPAQNPVNWDVVKLYIEQ